MIQIFKNVLVGIFWLDWLKSKQISKKVLVAIGWLIVVVITTLFMEPTLKELITVAFIWLVLYMYIIYL